MRSADTDRRQRLLRLEADELATRVRDLQVRLEVELDRTSARYARDAATILEDLVDVLDRPPVLHAACGIRHRPDERCPATGQVVLP